MRRSLAIIGGGLAGIAAAEAAVRRGFKVDLFEWSRVLGGRASSVFDPVAGCWLDNGQHLALGCCDEFLGLNERLGLSGFFERKDSIPFAQVGGRRWVIAPTSFLPASWQLLPAFLRIPLLSFRQRISTALTLRKLGKINKSFDRNENIELNNFTDGLFTKWLKSENIPPESVEKFWEPLILSSLCDTVDNVAFDAVQKVVRDGLLAGKNGLSVHIPKKPLRTIYNDETAIKLKSMGVNLHFLSRVTSLHWEFLSKQNYPENNNKIQINSNSNTEINPKNDLENNPEIDTEIDSKIDRKIDAEIDREIDAEIDSKIDREIDTEIDSKIDREINAEIDSEIDREIDAEIDSINIDASVVGDDDVDNGDDIDIDIDVDVAFSEFSDSDVFFRSGLLDSKSPVITGLEFSDGVVRAFDRYILAVPAFRAREILELSELETFSDGLGLAGFEPGAITSVHLWLGSRLLCGGHSHSALVGGLGQFLFCPQSVESDVCGFYHLVLISASHRILSEVELASVGASVLVKRVMRQLELTFKSSVPIKLLHYRVTTCFDAVFSPHPLVYSHRPPQGTPFANFAIAGDWTQTGWPSTLEGAVRSGILAVNSIDFDNEPP
ncbi:MAG: FAD-dependent oxidoreductase [Planctomycetaceae bacterium]|nr:FAD-dependent oxidoreductase [Planctomycetaceae bacterium]